jgi:hypothetical protein
MGVADELARPQAVKFLDLGSQYNLDHIDSSHFDEWVVDSGVDPEIVAANVVSLSGDAPYDYLLYSDNLPRRNDGRVVDWVLRRYKHVEDGGWWCSGEDLVELKKSLVDRRINQRLDDFIAVRMLWGQFKPSTPINDEAGKLIKYEAPPKTDTRAYALSHPHNARYWLEVLANETIPIVITEGAKKAGSMMSIGYASIALPGVTSGARKATGRLIDDLATVCAKGRPIYICFDHDTKEKTKRNVDKAISKLGRLFSIAGCTVKVILLPGPEKGVDDFIVARGKEAFDHCFQTALPLPQWETRRYSQLSYEPSLELYQEKLGAFSILGPQPKIRAYKSAKGTGKTEALIEIVDEAIRNGRWVLLMGHRVQLVQAVCKRVGLDYLTDVRNSEFGAILGYGLCVDSLHPESQARFNAEGWTNGVVIIDEAEQVIWHTLSAETEVKKHRIMVLRQLKQLFKNVLNSPDGQVVLLDADLSDLTIDFVRGLAESDVEPWICVNHWKPEEGWTIHHYHDKTPARLYAAIEDKIFDDERVLILTQAQGKKSKWGTRILAATLQEQFPHKRILFIDSKSVANPEHPAFGCISELNTVLLDYDIVICSPSIETGVSIDIQGHFGAVFGIFQGVTPADTVRQALSRLREPIERHVWIAPRGLELIGNGATSLRSLLAAQHKVVQLNIQLLQDVCMDLVEDEIDFNNTALNIWAKMAVRINAGMQKYRETVLAGLSEEGHTILDASQREVYTCTEEVAERLIVNQQTECQKEYEAISEADDLTEKQYEHLKDKKEKTDRELYQERKHFLQQRYGIDVTPELIEKDDNKWHSGIRLHYYATVGRKYLKDRDRRAISSFLKDGGGWIPSINKASLGAVVGVLDKLGIHDLLIEGEVFTRQTPKLVEMFDRAKQEWWAIKAILNIKIGEKDTPITFVQRLLGKLGLKLTHERRTGSAGAQLHCYRFEAIDDGREEVFAKWLERDEAAQTQQIVTDGKYIEKAA